MEESKNDEFFDEEMFFCSDSSDEDEPSPANGKHTQDGLKFNHQLGNIVKEQKKQPKLGFKSQKRLSSVEILKLIQN